MPRIWQLRVRAADDASSCRHACLRRAKQLEDTVFMATRFAGGVPGTLMATPVGARQSRWSQASHLRQRRRGRMGPRTFRISQTCAFWRAGPRPEPWPRPWYRGRGRAAGSYRPRVPRRVDRGVGQSLYRICPCGRRAPRRYGPSRRDAGDAHRRGRRRRRGLHRGYRSLTSGGGSWQEISVPLRRR